MLSCDATVKSIAAAEHAPANKEAGNPMGQSAFFHAEAPAACSGCAKAHGCGMQLLDQLAANSAQAGCVGPVPVASDACLQPGQRVRLSLSGSLLLRWVLAVYLMPLGLGIAAALLAEAVAGSAGQGWTVAAFAAGLGIAYPLLKLLQRLNPAFANPLQQLSVQPRVF